MRDMPSDIRGLLNSCLHFFGAIGILIYTSVSGHLYDSLGPWAPYALLGWCDAFICVLGLTLGLMGKFNKKKIAPSIEVESPQV